MTRGRTRPYTARGLARLPCTRCGRPSRFQWQACADHRRYRPLCARCDVDLNTLALRFMRIPGARALLARYRRRVLGGVR